MATVVVGAILKENKLASSLIIVPPFISISISLDVRRRYHLGRLRTDSIVDVERLRIRT